MVRLILWLSLAVGLYLATGVVFGFQGMMDEANLLYTGSEGSPTPAQWERVQELWLSFGIQVGAALVLMLMSAVSLIVSYVSRSKKS